MKIYTIQQEVDTVYDIYNGHVIIANSEEVISLAKSVAADEGADVWDSATLEPQGFYTGQKTEPFILLSDFNAG